MANDQENEDDLRIDGDRLVRVPIWVLQDVLSVLGLSERAEIPRKLATAATEEIRKRIAREIHPANGGGE